VGESEVERQRGKIGGRNRRQMESGETEGTGREGGEESGGEILKQKVNEEEAERGERHIRTYFREYPTGEIKEILKVRYAGERGKTERQRKRLRR
jgi:hypothetical protein